MIEIKNWQALVDNKHTIHYNGEELQSISKHSAIFTDPVSYGKKHTVIVDIYGNHIIEMKIYDIYSVMLKEFDVDADYVNLKNPGMFCQSITKILDKIII